MSESEGNLQKILDYCHKWCKKWMLKISEDHSNVVHCGKTRKPCTLFQFQCGNCFLKTVSHYRYLGIPFDENLTIVHCIKNRTRAASRAFGKLTSIFCELYDSRVEAVQDYASEIWGFKNT